MPDALVALGVITGAHGVRGELRVKPLNPESDLLEELEGALLREPGQGTTTRWVRIDGLRPHKQGFLMFFDGIHDRDAAEALRGSELCVRRSQLPELDDGEFYLIDLPGMRAVATDGTEVGNVIDAFAYPASEVAVVELAGGGRIELPLQEPYVVEVKLRERLLVIDHWGELDVDHRG